MKKILLTLVCLSVFINLKSQTLITIGSGNDTTGGYDSSPINIEFKSHHCQILYTASEINAAGWSGQGILSKIGFRIYGTTSEALPNFSIKVKNTLNANTTNYDGNGFSTVYTSSSYWPTAGGFELLSLGSQFMWDGVSNLLVDVCFDQVSAYTATGRVYTYPYTNPGSEYNYERLDNFSTCNLVTSQIISSSKPQIQLELTTPDPCSGMPMTDVTNASSYLVCPNTSFNLSLTNPVINTGFVYQWQSSPDGNNWSNIGSTQTIANYSITNITDTTYYRCLTTCTVSAQTNTSTPAIVNFNPLINCYCSPNVSWDCNGDKFWDFSFANLVNQSNNCDAGGYSDWSIYSFADANVDAGTTYTFGVNTYTSGNAPGLATMGVWMDFDQNAIFDTYEFYSLGFGSAGSYSTSIQVPITAPSGSVRMRLKLDANNGSAFTTLDPCNNNNSSSYGQVIDHKVNVTAAPTCSGTPTAGNAISTASAVCQDKVYTIDLTGSSVSSDLTYQWQSSPNGTTWTNLGSSQNTIPYTVNTQSVTTHYRCVVTCINSALSGTSSVVTVNQNLPTACYCEPQNINCSSSYITNVLFESLTDAPICNSSNGYTYNSTLTAVPLTANQSHTISIDVESLNGTAYVGMWIDYNQDGNFDLIEKSFSTVVSPGPVNLTYTVNVPFTAIGGNTRMRVKMENNWGDVLDLNPCTNYYNDGQVIDYLINISPTSSCTGTPNAGSTISSATIVCADTPVTLDLTGNSIASNMNYQWQSSPNGTTWTNLGANQTFVPYTVSSQSISTYYRCITTCLTSALSATSSAISISQNLLTDCYCTPPASDCSFGSQIMSVLMSTLNNTSTCSVNGYMNYSGSVPSVSLNIAQSYSIEVKVGRDYNNYASVWIDYNQNGVFDTNEYTDLGSPAGGGDSTIYSSIIIPSNALLGNTKMRVRNNINYSFYDNEPCAGGGNQGRGISSMLTGEGETEDYMITILQQNCSTVSFSTAIPATGTNTICFGEATPLNITSTVTAVTGLTYQWKASTGGTYTNENLVISTSSIMVTPTVNTSYYCEIMCDGNVMINSDTVFVTVKPSTNISGTVTVFPNTATPVAGRVILYKYEPFYTKFDSVAGQNIGTAGDYNFTSFHSGVYIIKTIPNASNLQIAYGDTAVNWKTAKQIIHGCDDNDIQNIQVKPLPLFTQGPGTLMGTIISTLGFRQQPNDGFKSTMLGTPIPGVIVKGGRNPGGQMLVQTTTDASGSYTLTGLPINDVANPNEKYFVLVDIPGLDTNSTYRVRITAADTNFINLNFVVDSIEITPVNDPNVGIKNINAIEHQLKVFPNPADNVVSIHYNLQYKSTVKIELFDILGKSVKTLMPLTEQSIDSYKTKWQIDDLNAGLYFIKMSINNSEITIKLSISK